ncbi:YceI family protein [Pontibacter liquoris]|uniref:YceI family protein n=1 Tax=Pontibacter liquoris TaxID=2905677 RepID=UPI001FA73DA8|nr:YceI family protein [Pontibacter liquoris]
MNPSTETKSIWTVDQSHSQIKFAIRHMLISEVEGNFGDFTLEVTSSGEDFSDAAAEVTIQVASITTGNTDRDNHLRANDFFDVAHYPVISFKSTSVTQLDEEEFKLTGELTIRDVTKEVTLNVTKGGVIKDPYGYTRAGFQVEGKIDRFDFGLQYNALMETGGAMLGKQVKVKAQLELIKQQ